MHGQPVIVSACLLGIRSRYDGTDSLSEEVITSLKGAFIIPVCPEQLGGLPTPRPRADIIDADGLAVIEGRARVVDEKGVDITDSFLKGAEEVLKIAGITGARLAIFKEKSPSCGVNAISRDGNVAAGRGVTAALLQKEGLEVKGIG